MRLRRRASTGGGSGGGPEPRSPFAAAPSPAGLISPVAQTPRKTRAAALSITSNAILIALKVVAVILTGSIAILTEPAHSAIDPVASGVADYSIRKADEPADEAHM